MTVQVLRASESEASIIEALLDDYLLELVGHREIPVGATDAVSYPYLWLYWSEPDRYPFTIWIDGTLAGFALIHRVKDTTADVMQLAEFFIVPEKRRQGIGEVAVQKLWGKFPGKWELQVHIRNTAAIAFWSRCIKEHAGKNYEVEEIMANDGRRLFFHFSVE